MIANLSLLDFMVTFSRAPKLRLLDDSCASLGGHGFDFLNGIHATG